MTPELIEAITESILCVLIVIGLIVFFAGHVIIAIIKALKGKDDAQDQQ